MQIKSYWYLLTGLGVGASFVAAACTVSSSSDVDFGSAGEADTAGTTSAGASGSGGSSAGMGGAGGGIDPTTVPACDTGDTPAGTPASTCDAEVADDCTACLKAHCCAEYRNCFSTSPGDVCGYGGPNNGGEFACYQGCVQALFTTNGSADDSDREACANGCVTSTDSKSALDCGTLGNSTNALIGCIMDNRCNGACYGG